MLSHFGGEAAQCVAARRPRGRGDPGARRPPRAPPHRRPAGRDGASRHGRARAGAGPAGAGSAGRGADGRRADDGRRDGPARRPGRLPDRPRAFPHGFTLWLRSAPPSAASRRPTPEYTDCSAQDRQRTAPLPGRLGSGQAPASTKRDRMSTAKERDEAKRNEKKELMRQQIEEGDPRSPADDGRREEEVRPVREGQGGAGQRQGPPAPLLADRLASARRRASSAPLQQAQRLQDRHRGPARRAGRTRRAPRPEGLGEGDEHGVGAAGRAPTSDAPVGPPRSASQWSSRSTPRLLWRSRWRVAAWRRASGTCPWRREKRSASGAGPCRRRACQPRPISVDWSA